jgi:ATP-dependent Clp protease, protease subunit
MYALHPTAADPFSLEDKPAEDNKDEGKGKDAPKMEAQLLFKARIVPVFGEIDDALAQRVCLRLLALAEESDKPIKVFVSSPGGHVESGDAIHDMVQFINAPVTMIGSGWVASAGTHIFLAAPKERRVCLPNTRFMIHQPSGGARGRATDIAIQAREIITTRERLSRIVAERTGQPAAKVAEDMERDLWMNTDEAIEYGLLSRVVKTQAELGL